MRRDPTHTLLTVIAVGVVVMAIDDLDLLRPALATETLVRCDSITTTWVASRHSQERLAEETRMVMEGKLQALAAEGYTRSLWSESYAIAGGVSGEIDYVGYLCMGRDQ